MGEVYEAKHERLAHRYAVKFLHPGVRDHPEALPRFMREAQITSRLRHPGIVSVVDFNHLPSGVAYLVMEYLDGESLGKLLARIGPMPLPRIVDITDQLSAALTAAHLQGVVHRDMHPQNVFVLPGTGGQSDRIKILDFGISKIASISQRITGMAAVLGTPQYMSPEQAEGKTDELDAKSDQFSLATIVYELLTGKTAFSGETLASIAYQIVHAAPLPIKTYRPELPAELESVVSRALSKNKKDRFPSVSEFAVHLRWTATLPTSEVSPKPSAEQAATSFDAEETTAVSALPSGMAEVLRESGLPARDSGRRDSIDDELTVVNGSSPSNTDRPMPAPNNEPTVVGRQVAERLGWKMPEMPTPLSAPASEGLTVIHDLTIAGSPRRRRLIIGAVAGSGLLAAAIALGLAVRAGRPPIDRARAAPTAESRPVAAAPPAAEAHPAAAAPPAAARPAAAAPAAEAPAAAARAPSAADAGLAAATPTPAPVDDPAPSERPPASEAVEPRKQSSRSRSRVASAAKDRAATTPAPIRSGSDSGQCRITVGTYPWSDLWVDGADTGQQTPVVGMPIACGHHRLEFRRRDLRINQIENVILSEGREFRQQYELRGSGVDD
jgi:serine/threonine-protein kinase